ncbi:HD domain-containing phosphohydrolase [Effusibacillus lacus]|uniref:Chemotaxis protein CheY n=1 Tax=Effusibacillus lacus TaxID=1348429 RepID=A0A292YKT5_9BACL|nr:HD domain-containing phosphohydrolase [Effusibacillus lacus]TCS70532.1 HAMP domain-containing protein [Effusibacillus lacus]GAX89521.1 hypothetical protein EFBL_1145 [Effusibacillus lacus]
MNVYNVFLRTLLRNYILGTMITVVGVGGILNFSTLHLTRPEMWFVAAVFVLSSLMMFAVESIVFFRQIRPIRRTFEEPIPTLEEIRNGYLQTLKFPVLSAKRIVGPHAFGFSLPAMALSIWGVQQGLFQVPYYYVVFAAVGALLIAGMHSVIEFFLTTEAIRPVLDHIRYLTREMYMVDVPLEGAVIVSLREKFLVSALLIGTVPLSLFCLASLFHLGRMSGIDFWNYWQWAGIILIIGIGFATLGAWLLSRNIQQPIEHMQHVMQRVKEGDLQVRAADTYSDEFSRVVAGFNHMVEGLQRRDLMNQQLIDSYFVTLAGALDARDPYTAGHSVRVAEYSVRIGQAAGLSQTELAYLKKSALLHDIGKIAIPDAILLKEGKLTDEEFLWIKLHPELGESLLRKIQPAEAMAPLLPGVRSHHERYDGKGYPDGLVGNQIPLFGRIIAVADSFDAMTSDRPYRMGMPVEKALLILNEGKGTQWDPELTRLFIESFEEGKTGISQAHEGVEPEEMPG